MHLIYHDFISRIFNPCKSWWNSKRLSISIIEQNALNRYDVTTIYCIASHHITQKMHYWWFSSWNGNEKKMLISHSLLWRRVGNGTFDIFRCAIKKILFILLTRKCTANIVNKNRTKFGLKFIFKWRKKTQRRHRLWNMYEISIHQLTTTMRQR